jgi:hypothetical protein
MDKFLNQLDEIIISNQQSELVTRVKTAIKASGVQPLKTSGSGRYGHPVIVQGGYTFSSNPQSGIISIGFVASEFSKGNKESQWMNMIISKLLDASIEYSVDQSDRIINIKYPLNVIGW